MTISFIVECDVCHHKYVLKCQCDHVMNHGSMPIRVGCKNCGNILRGEISAQSLVITNGIKHECENLLEPYPYVGVSTELPICVDCYFTDRQLLNNYLCLPSYVNDANIHNHSQRMSILADSMSQTLNDLQTLYNIYCNGNISVFSTYVEEKFGKDKNELIKDRNGTQFVAVRFGNVLGSNGSVIPLFKKQIEAGGPVTVTHPDIIRYFMTIPEAVSLVLQAGTYAWGGEIFVLDMGAPVKIDTLARNLIRLSGYKPDVDIKIVYSGLRPGEKLFEEKLMAEEGMMKTDNELIHIGEPIPFDTETFLGQLGELARASYNNDENIVEMVEKIVPTFNPVGDKPTGNEKYGRNDVAVSAAK